MKQRHPAPTLRVPGAQAGGMRRITPSGATPIPGAEAKPTQGGAEPQAPTPHMARRHVTKAAKAPKRVSSPRAKQRRTAAKTAATPTATATSGHTAAIRLDDLSFAANQPGSYQRMGGF